MAQPNNRNYVVTETFHSADASASSISVQYYDGLGRPSISATNAAGGYGMYLYSQTIYDSVGRDSVNTLPVIGTSNIGYPEVMPMLQTTYNDSHSFSTKQYDALNRVIQESTPGDKWHTDNKFKSQEYATNAVEEVKYYLTDMTQSSPVLSGYYQPNTLHKQVVTDEDNHSKTVYKDKNGNVVLERTDGNIDTYYVYSGNILRFVLTPQFQESGSIEKDAYIYKYDNMNRCCEKKLPGCDPVIYRYGRDNRMVITQDPLLREKSLYRFTLYDELGRVALQGTCQQYNPSMLNSNLTVRFNSGFGGIAGSCYSFADASSSSFISSPVIEVVSFYDSYGFFNPTTRGALYGNFSNLDAMHPSTADIVSGNNAKGYKTGEIIAASNGTHLFNSYFYDQRGRVIEDHHSTLNGDVYKVFTEYSFTNKPTSVTKVIPSSSAYSPRDTVMVLSGEHIGAKSLAPASTSNSGYAITTSYSYNSHNDQLESVSIQCGDNTPVVVSQISYDDLGRIQSNAHPEINDVITYDYDLHGWTTEIDGTYFKEKLHYADGPDNKYYCYNGDISSQFWMTPDTAVWRGYKFQYNDRDMLYKAFYGEGDNLSVNKNRYDEYILDIDSNGGILRFQRKGQKIVGNYGTIDLLYYDYDGNKISGIRDRYTTQLSYTGAFEYKDTHVATETEPDFEYNSAGMLIKDRDKGINRIKYNDICLVDSIVFDNGAKVEYTYGLNGEKLKVSHVTEQSSTASARNLVSAGPMVPTVPGIRTNIVRTTEYIGADVELEGENMAYGKTYKYYFGDGYVQFYPGSSQSPQYYFYSKDHLGNIRSVVTKNPTTNEIAEVQQTHYYPFGGIIADLSTGRSVQNKLYNGKELDTSNNLWWYDYGARQYDPTAPRFITPDPLAEKYYGWNAYGYCMNNPVKYIDPDGRDGVKIIDVENKTITIRANYYVVTEGGNCPYTKNDVENFNKTINAEFNKQVEGKTITKGQYKGYTIKFDFTFIDGGSSENAKSAAHKDVIFQENSMGNKECLHQGNMLSREDDKEHESFIPKANGDVVGGETAYKRNITMNISHDSLNNRTHELGHTLGLKHPKGRGTSGLMAYPPEELNQHQINKLGNSNFLKTVNRP